MAPAFKGDVNIAMKIPKAQYDATVAFYRDTLGLTVTKEDPSETPTVAETHKVKFGPIILWLDRNDTYSQTDLWLQVHTDQLDTATERLATTGIAPCDELEPFEGVDFRGHWIKNPAGVVHLLAERLTPAAPESGG